MFVRIQETKDKNGSPRYYASIVRNVRVKGKVVQNTVAYLGAVTESQIPYLKAAYAKEKPKLVWEDGTQYPE